MTSWRKYTAGLLLVIMILSVYTIMAQEQNKKMQKINVELDIFSGRPNPSWELSSEEVSELVRYMDGLIPVSQPAVASILGYRGFVISNIGKITGLPVKIHVFNGILTVTENGSTNYYKDVNNVENWLIGKAKEHGYGDIINEIIKSKSK